MKKELEKQEAATAANGLRRTKRPFLDNEKEVIGVYMHPGMRKLNLNLFFAALI